MLCAQPLPSDLDTKGQALPVLCYLYVWMDRDPFVRPGRSRSFGHGWKPRHCHYHFHLPLPVLCDLSFANVSSFAFPVTGHHLQPPALDTLLDRPLRLFHSHIHVSHQAPNLASTLCVSSAAE